MKPRKKRSHRAILLGPMAVSSRSRKTLLKKLKITHQDFLIGVDGGTRFWLEEGYQPHLAVGDWDSLTHHKRYLKTIPSITLSIDKDRSDLFFAALAALEAGFQDLVCVGVSGGRPDHQLAMLKDLSDLSTGRYGRLSSVQVKGEDADYHFLSASMGTWKGEQSVGSIVSLFAMGGAASGVSLSGLSYPLTNAKLLSSSHGLSNRATQSQLKVKLKKGNLVIMIPHRLKNHEQSYHF